jgi:uncharacterized protein YyaL (SSP411 family)
LSRYGRVGMMDLIPRVKSLWENQRDNALSTAQNLTDHIKKMSAHDRGDGLNLETYEKAFIQLSGLFDSKRGGFSSAPKFPSAHNLLFLLRYWKKTKSASALLMVEKTLLAMRLGGIFDQIGFGFHRYSTDEKWLVPHFEKMLYDQAMLKKRYIKIRLRKFSAMFLGI